MKNKAKQFLLNNKGNVATILALAALPLFAMLGLGIDLALISSDKSKLQSVADTAVLNAAIRSDVGTDSVVIEKYVNEQISLHGSDYKLVDNPVVKDGQVCILIEKPSPSYFIKLINVQNYKTTANSCAAFKSKSSLEIAMVLDVSSSMIEEGRFAPMQLAAKQFIDAIKAFAPLTSSTKISLVPFSNRVNIGMPNANNGWLKPFESKPAIPDRWTDPDSVYGSYPTFSKSFWIDGSTPLVTLVTTITNYYWMGCIEPRSDVEVYETGDVGAYGLTDDTPATAPFIAIDYSPGFAARFCPPPIIPLFDDFDKLSNVVDSLTSQGTTRIDAGMVSGWYTLSPKWKSTWPTSSAPQDYGKDIKKIVVFMTDGQMNTQYGQAGKLDWRCNNMQSTTTSSLCNDAANNDLVKICDSMKSEGIEIYTVAYGNDADKNFIKKCATDDSHFFTAEADTSDPNYIENIYKSIAARIRQSVIHITK